MRDAMERVLSDCLGLRPDEHLLILADPGSDERAVDALAEEARSRHAVVDIVWSVPPPLPGGEPSLVVSAAMQAADAVIELTSVFIGSSKARQAATAGGVRYLTMPGIRLESFRDGGPLTVNFRAIAPITVWLSERLTAADSFRLTSRAGTDLRGSLTGRRGRALHGLAQEPGAYMAPPDIEAGTAPVEGTGEGVVVVDGDLLFMGQGPLPSAVVMEFQHGTLRNVHGPESPRLLSMLDRCADDLMVNLAEVAVGLNPLGYVGSIPMETESALGTAHIALGNSLAYGGTVDAVAHLDCVMRDATLELDGVVVLAEGRLIGGPRWPLES